MAPQELTLPGVAQRNRKAALTMSALFVLVLCLIFIFARWYLHDSRAQLLREMGQDMNSQASGKVALLTVWSGTLAGQVNIFVAQDMLRLFAAEVASAGVPATDMLQMARLSQNGAEADTEPPADTASNSELLKKIAPRLPLMVDYLSDFMEKNSFSGASLVNTDMQMYLAPEGVQPPDEEQKPYLQQALNSKQPVLMPVRRENGRLVMDMAFPIFAPLYVDSTGDRVVSLLLATYSVLPVTAAATGEAGNGSQYNTFILQSFGEKLQRIAPTEVSGVSDLPGWSLHDEKLPLGTRIDPGLPEGEREIYGLALPVPNLPWLVEQTLPMSRIDEKFAGIRQNVVVASLIMAALAGGLLAALWWSLVSRNERAVAEQMHKLYLVVNQQKQIMDGVNSALSAGIVLNDLNGVIHYANQSFARLCGREKATELRGLKYSELDMELARSLVTHTLAVHRAGEPFSFAEALLVDGKLRYYLTSCTPFRDENGRLSGMVSVYSDMTDIAVAQQRSQQMVAQTVNA